MTDATYTFMPWVRQGALQSITKADEHPHTSGLPDHASFDITVKINDQAEPQPVSVSLYGPGEVRGFDHRQVVRTEPKPYSSDFEPNYFAAIEFDRPDFPWLFTPAAPGTANQLRPWICLVVVPRDEPTIKLTVDATRPVPVLTITANAGEQLPALSESWAWAHAQVAGPVTGGQGLKQVLEQSPERTVSRLLCPRRLDPDTAYYACVVPTFEAGRLAGLDRPVPAPAGADGGLGAAWSSASNDRELPVYYYWEFSTGPAGDFESLVTLLERRDAPQGAGAQPMDIGVAGAGLPAIAPANTDAVVGLEGALRAPDLAPPDPPMGPAGFRAALERILNAPATLKASDPSLPGAVGPPIYGAWQAGRRTIPEERRSLPWWLRWWERIRKRDDRPYWLRDLNLDARYRAAAGFGTQVAREDQEALMEAAWEQVEEIEAVNALLRRARLARQVAGVLHRRELVQLDAGPLLSVAQAAKTRMLMSPRTLAHEIRRSALPDTVLAPGFRRITRPRGPLIRRENPAGELRVRAFAERINSGDVAPAPTRGAPSGTTSLEDAADRLFPWFLPRWLRGLLPRLPLVLLLAALVLLILFLVFLLLGLATVAALLAVSAGVLLGIAAWLRTYVPKARVATAIQPPALTPEAVEEVPGRPDFVLIAPDAESPPAPSEAAGPDNDVAARFREAAVDHFRGLRRTVDAEPEPPASPLELEDVRATLIERLDPATTVPGAVLPRLEIADAEWEPDDPLEEILVAPSFPTPMYKRLRDVAKEMLLPGVDKIPPNTLTLLETNPRFIEAFMVGLNHEMSRELLWREYPTDMRGTYFRQFWDPRGRVPSPTTEAEREQALDIPRIHQWPRANRLGDTVSAGKPEGMLVLLIRGQLLLRYPTTVIYASKADLRPGEKNRKPIAPPNHVERHPLFTGSFPPDITFLGFDLTADEARGGPAPAAGSSQTDPGTGWFFIFQQQPTELRFGLDEPASDGAAPETSAGMSESESPFAVLTWDDVAVTSKHLSVEDSKPRPKVQPLLGQGWGKTAADMAYAVMQSPYRVAISADDMLAGS